MDNFSSELYTRLMARANKPGILTYEMGLMVTGITDGGSLGVLTPVSSACNARGIVHGGALFSVMDQMGGMAACSKGNGVVTVSGHIDYLRTCPPGATFRCTGTVVKAGRTLIVCTTEITEENGQAVAIGSFTYSVREHLSPKSAPSPTV